MTNADRKPSPAVSNFNRLAPLIYADLRKEFPQLSPVDVYAILGNLGHESLGMTAFQEGNPTVPGSMGGWGWGQWTGMNCAKGGRRCLFNEWVKEKGFEPRSYAANLGFLIHELKGTQKNAITKLLAAKPVGEQTLLEAKVVAFELEFERAGANAKHYPSRFVWARRAQAAIEANQTSVEPKPQVGPVVEKPITPAPEMDWDKVNKPIPETKPADTKSGFLAGLGIMLAALGAWAADNWMILVGGSALIIAALILWHKMKG